MLTHQQQTRRKARLWQFSALAVAGVGACILALPPIRSVFAPPALVVKSSTNVSAVEQAKEDLNEFDPTTVGSMLTRLSAPVAPAPEVPPEPMPNEPMTTQAPAAPVATGEWAYVGSIITPQSRHALVRIDGQQRIFAVGAKERDTTLVVIEKDHIEIDLGGKTQRIDLAARTMLAPTDPPKRPVTFRQPPASANQGGMPGMPGMASTPGAMPGIPGNMGLAQPSLRPGMSANAPANATFDQNRLMLENQRRAEAEQARREREAKDKEAGVAPERTDPMQDDPARQETLLKVLAEPDLTQDMRMGFLRELGVVPGMSVEAALNRLRSQGINPDDPAYAQTVEAIESNAKFGSGPGEGK